jgi:nicotinate-nucleotide adenylyltransferase
MRIGVFGGTFDPVHLGHLIFAEQAREQARLDRVLFVPAARPPHKLAQPMTPFVRRSEMLALATAGQPAFRVDELEKDRPGPSYTADTLADLKAREGGAELFLLLGSDCLPDLAGWHEPQRIFELATILVMARPGWAIESASSIPKIQKIDAPLVDISSRDLRQRVAAARTIRYLVPAAVDAYIASHRLYQATEP